MNYQKKIVTLDQLRSIVDEAHAQKKVVVQCHGCFDILHPGHLRHLAWAKQQGDLLIVSVSADNVVKKGSLRPYIPQDLRAENLAALEFVDYVTIDDHEWAGPILELLKPDIYTKGKEFENIAEIARRESQVNHSPEAWIEFRIRVRHVAPAEQCGFEGGALGHPIGAGGDPEATAIGVSGASADTGAPQ